MAGRLADRGRDRASLAVLLVATLASWGLLALGASSLVALIAGLVVFDAGIQGSHINNQDAINRLRPEARSRMTTAYMVSFFAGGVLGSMLSATVYAAAGWDGDVRARRELRPRRARRRPPPPRRASPRARGGRARPGSSLDAVTRSVIFDCDGVLVDTELVSNTIFAELLTEAGLPTTLEDCMREFRGRSVASCLEIAERASAARCRSTSARATTPRSRPSSRTSLSPCPAWSTRSTGSRCRRASRRAARTTRWP